MSDMTMMVTRCERCGRSAKARLCGACRFDDKKGTVTARMRALAAQRRLLCQCIRCEADVTPGTDRCDACVRREKTRKKRYALARETRV